MPGHRANRPPRGLCQATLAEAAKGFPHKCPMGQYASSASNLRKNAALEILGLESQCVSFKLYKLRTYRTQQPGVNYENHGWNKYCTCNCHFEIFSVDTSSCPRGQAAFFPSAKAFGNQVSKDCHRRFPGCMAHGSRQSTQSNFRDDVSFTALGSFGLKMKWTMAWVSHKLWRWHGSHFKPLEIIKNWLNLGSHQW